MCENDRKVRQAAAVLQRAGAGSAETEQCVAAPVICGLQHGCVHTCAPQNHILWNVDGPRADCKDPWRKLDGSSHHSRYPRQGGDCRLNPRCVVLR